MFFSQRPGLSLFLVYLVVLGSSGLVHLFDSDFAGKLTTGDQSQLIRKGQQLYESRACLGCHGKAGKAPQAETYPIIAFQNALYLEEQTKMIRDGVRSSGASSIMAAGIQNLTDYEAKLISLYLSKQR